MGRLVVIAAGTLGLAGVVGYAVMQVQARTQAEAAAQRVQVDPRAETPTIPQLVSRAQLARDALDTPALIRIEGELAAAAAHTSTTPKALEARRERLAVLGTLAVEASVRATALGDAQARQRAREYATQARALVDALGDALDPEARLATEARLTLASGGDVLTSHPSVMLPAFHDRELQHAVLLEALTRADSERADSEPDSESDDPEHPSDDPSAGPRAELLRSLQEAPDPSGLEQALLAVTLLASGKPERAQTMVDSLLAGVPDQPLALALRDRLREGSLVAVAEPSRVPGIDPDFPIVEPEPDLVVEPDPEPDPDLVIDPEPDPDSDPDLIIDPDPEPDAGTKPKPDAGTKPKPNAGTKPKPDAGTKPKPDAGTKPKPAAAGSKRKSPSELTEEGCTLVRSGDAQEGFSLLQKAFDLNPRDTRVTLCMSEGHMKLGRLPSARAMVERVLSTSPKNKKALLLAAKIENKLGNKRAALDYYRRVLEIDPGNATAQTYVDNNG